MSVTFGFIFILSGSRLEDKHTIQEWITKVNEDFRFDFDRELEKRCQTYYAFSGRCFTSEQLDSVISTLRLLESERKKNEIRYYQTESFSLIYHTEFTLMNTHLYAYSLSQLIPNRILYISGFTGEGFAIGIYNNADLLVCHQIGIRDCLECHNLVPISGNIDTICNNLPMFDPTLLKEFHKKRNAFYAQELFIEAMPISYREAIHKIQNYDQVVS